MAFDVYGTHSMIWEGDCKLTDDLFTNQLYHDSNFLLYVNSSDVAPTNVTNVIINGIAKKEIVLKDNRPFYCPKDFSAGNVSYTHNYSMETGYDDCAGWESIALPFDVKTITHETAGELSPFGSNNTQGKKFWLYALSSRGFVEASAIEANTPYIISMPNNSHYGKDYNIPGKVTFSATNAVVRRTDGADLKSVMYEGATFCPNYVKTDKSGAYYLLNVTNDYYTYYGAEEPGSMFISNYRGACPFEGMLVVNKSHGNSPYFTISFAKGNITGIQEFVSANSKDVWYTLNGRKLQNRPTQKGIYIHNDQKVVIR